MVQLLSLLSSKHEEILDWFVDGITTKVGLGFQMYFWFDPWIWSMPIKDRFHVLFMFTKYTKRSVGEVERWVSETLIWDFKWRRYFFVHKELVIVEFL